MIEARNLVKRYGSTMAVNDLSFSIRPGLVTGFLGPNGAGKTTTMRMILGLDAPTQGSVTVGGRSYRDLPAPMREVGALLDAKALHGGRRARDHLLCLAHSNGIPRSRVDEVLRIVGLEGVARRRAKGFSLGMGQRLGIASALLGDPAVLIFDEPVNGLDPDGIHWVRTLLRALAAEGRTVLVSSHLMSEMALTADHLLVIGKGRLIAAVVASDPELRGRDHPQPPDLDRLAAAEAEPGQQALLVLACLRKGETFASLAAGFGVGTATAWRYVEETVALLAARAPRLRKAVRDAARAGHAYAVLDGTLIPIDRVARGPALLLRQAQEARHVGRRSARRRCSTAGRTARSGTSAPRPGAGWSAGRSGTCSRRRPRARWRSAGARPGR